MWVLSTHDGASAKHHLVLGEGARLVREYVFNLSQVLCDVERLTLDLTVCFLIIEVYVIGDEEDLTDLDQFNGHIEGDGNQDLEGKDEFSRECGEKKKQNRKKERRKRRPCER